MSHHCLTPVTPMCWGVVNQDSVWAQSCVPFAASYVVALLLLVYLVCVPSCVLCTVCSSCCDVLLSAYHAPLLPLCQTINAQQLAAASFGSVMLQTVGRVYQTEADIYQGNPLLGGLGKLRRAGHSIK